MCGFNKFAWLIHLVVGCLRDLEIPHSSEKSSSRPNDCPVEHWNVSIDIFELVRSWYGGFEYLALEFRR